MTHLELLNELRTVLRTEDAPEGFASLRNYLLGRSPALLQLLDKAEAALAATPAAPRLEPLGELGDSEYAEYAKAVTQKDARNLFDLSDHDGSTEYAGYMKGFPAGWAAAMLLAARPTAPAATAGAEVAASAALNAALKVLEGYEKWEAEIISCDAAWATRTGHPWRTEELYDEMIDWKSDRNVALEAIRATLAPAPAPYATR